jgi:lsr operon transcriptional repressor
MSCLQHLSGFISSQQVRLVTLSGGVGPYMTGIGQLDAACRVSIIPAPLRVSSADVADILRRESSVRDVILAATAADAAVVGSAPSTSAATPPSCAPATSAKANS